MKKAIYTCSIITILASSMLLSSCYGNYDIVGMVYGQSPRSDERFENSMDYNQNAGYPTIVVPQDEYKVYYGTDMHVDTSWNHTTKWTTALRNDANCYFGIILGDIINAINHFEDFNKGVEYNPLTQAANKPLFATVGNHDLYYGQWKEYLKYWHTSTYYLTVKTPNYTDLFICMDSGDGTWGRKQFDWLRKLLADMNRSDYRHVTVYTHTHLFKRDSSQGHTSNYALEETYEIADLLDKGGVEWYVSGHCHCRDIADYKNTKYIIVDALEEHESDVAYMVGTFGEKLSYEFISLD